MRKYNKLIISIYTYLEPYSKKMIQQRLYQKMNNNRSDDSTKQNDNDSWEYHYHRIISGLEGSYEQKQAIVRKRILRYFGEFKIDSESYLALRNDADYKAPGIQIIPSRIILYGVDYMTIQRAKNYFQGFITNIRRMDDSHFLVQFRSQNQCLTAINKCKKTGQTFFNSSQVLSKSKNGWIQFKPYHQFIFERRLMARHCTTMDRFDNANVTTKQSYTLAYSQAKRRFMKSLKQDVSKYETRFQSKGHAPRSGSRSRSKQNCYNKIDQRYGYGRQRGNNRPSRTCYCDHQKNHQRKRSRSRSSSSFNSQDQSRRNGSLPKLLQQEKIREANFKFDLYIKRRDQVLSNDNLHSKNQGNNNLNSSKAKAPVVIDITKQNYNSKDKNRIREKQQSISTSSDCQVRVGDFLGMNEKKKDNLDMSQSQQQDFEMFLQKLKLEDSKNQYSAFDLDSMLQ